MSSTAGAMPPRARVLLSAKAIVSAHMRVRHDSVLLTSFVDASVNDQGLGVLPTFVAGVSPVLAGSRAPSTC